MAMTSSMEAVDSSAAALRSSARASTCLEVFMISRIEPDISAIIEFTAPTSILISFIPLFSSISEVRSPFATASIFSATARTGFAMLFASQSETRTMTKATTATAIRIAVWMARTGARNSAIGVVTAATQPVCGTGVYTFIWSLPLKKYSILPVFPARPSRIPRASSGATRSLSTDGFKVPIKSF